MESDLLCKLNFLINDVEQDIGCSDLSQEIKSKLEQTYSTFRSQDTERIDHVTDLVESCENELSHELRDYLVGVLLSINETKELWHDSRPLDQHPHKDSSDLSTGRVPGESRSILELGDSKSLVACKDNQTQEESSKIATGSVVTVAGTNSAVECCNPSNSVTECTRISHVDDAPTLEKHFTIQRLASTQSKHTKHFVPLPRAMAPGPRDPDPTRSSAPSARQVEGPSPRPKTTTTPPAARGESVRIRALLRPARAAAPPGRARAPGGAQAVSFLDLCRAISSRRPPAAAPAAPSSPPPPFAPPRSVTPGRRPGRDLGAAPLNASVWLR